MRPFFSVVPALLALVGVYALIPLGGWGHASTARAASRAVEWNGTYRFVGNPGELRALNDAVEELLESLPVLARGIARTRIMEAVEPYPSLAVTLNDDEIRVTLGDHEIASPRSGRAVRSTTPTGARASVRQEIRGRDLVQVLHTRNGTRRNHFHLGSNGTHLELSVQVSSDRLSSDLAYSLTYRRAS